MPVPIYRTHGAYRLIFHSCQQYKNVQHCHDNVVMGHFALFYFMLLCVLLVNIKSVCPCHCVSCPSPKWQLLYAELYSHL